MSGKSIIKGNIKGLFTFIGFGILQLSTIAKIIKYGFLACVFLYVFLVAIFSKTWIQSPPSYGISKLLYNVCLYLNIIIMTPQLGGGVCFFLYLYLLFTSGMWGRTLLLLYYTHLIFDTAPQRGGWDEDVSPFTLFGVPFLGDKMGWKLRERIRSWRGSLLLKKYFQNAELVSAVKDGLDPNRNYLFVYHPHGVLGFGGGLALGTNACGFLETFPGVHRSISVLNVVFLIPFYREWLLMIGFISCSRSTLRRQLTTKEPFCKSVLLIPGGAAEALHAHPNVFHLHIKQRKGFIRLAMETGCSIVPCLGFGENEMYHTVYSGSPSSDSNNLLFRIQTKLLKVLTFSTPVLTHILPNRVKIVVVVGEPIHFSKDVQEEKDVDKYHDLYLERLHKLYDQYKASYGYEDVPMKIY